MVFKFLLKIITLVMFLKDWYKENKWVFEVKNIIMQTYKTFFFLYEKLNQQIKKEKVRETEIYLKIKLNTDMFMSQNISN